MDAELLAAVAAGFSGGLLARYVPGIRVNWRRFKLSDHKHIWNGSDGKHGGLVMQRCLVEGCRERRWKPND